MQPENAALKGHVVALEKAFKADSPNQQEVEMHAAALVLKFEKTNMANKKMDMSDKN
ncbi:MAG: hypothetical protein ABIP06_05140 [Pyrinomonadaceae bacterium]